MRSTEDALAAAIGPGQVRRGRERDAVDGILPDTVVTATNTRDVATCIAECLARKHALIPQGGGTTMRFGNKPSRYDVKLSLAGMARVVSRNPDDLTVTVDAGIPLSQLNRLLASDGQRVALDADAAHRATLGGLAATDRRGTLSFRYGGPRDQILGMTVVDGCGRELRIGGRVVKNVAGYDLVRLFVGSFGTLGIVTGITIRTYPLAQTTVETGFDFDRAEQADAVRRRIYASRLTLSGLDLRADIDGSSPRWQLRCLLEGGNAEIAHLERELETIAEVPATVRSEIGGASVRSDPEEARTLHLDDETVAVRMTAAPDRAIHIADKARSALAQKFERVRIDGRLGDGSFRFSTDAARSADALSFVRTIESACENETRAHAVTEIAPDELKSTLDVWGGVVSGFHLMKRIKRKFDPSGVLSPGRFVGRL